MAKTTGGVRSGNVTGNTGGLSNDGGGNSNINITNIGSLKAMKNRELQREIQQGISKFESRLGVKSDVKLATMEGAVGLAKTDLSGKTEVFLNRKHFEKADVKTVNEYKNRAYKSKFLNKTNKPTQHTVVHELSHALWNSHKPQEKHQKAGKEINKLYKNFKKDNPKSWGSYSKTNVNEFYAEGITKGILGESDKYTKSLIKITKKYGL